MQPTFPQPLTELQAHQVAAPQAHPPPKLTGALRAGSCRTCAAPQRTAAAGESRLVCCPHTHINVSFAAAPQIWGCLPSPTLPHSASPTNAWRGSYGVTVREGCYLWGVGPKMIKAQPAVGLQWEGRSKCWLKGAGAGPRAGRRRAARVVQGIGRRRREESGEQRKIATVAGEEESQRTHTAGGDMVKSVWSYMGPATAGAAMQRAIGARGAAGA